MSRTAATGRLRRQVNKALVEHGHHGVHDVDTGELISDALDVFAKPLRLRAHSWSAVRDRLRDECGEAPSVQWLINELPHLNRPAHELIDELQPATTT